MSKVILITGTSTGVGIALAVQAAQAGHTVYATMRNLEKRAGLDQALADAAVTANILQLDVQDTVSVEAAVTQIISEQGRIDVLINNAGQGYARSLEQGTEEDIARVHDINYMGVVRCTKAVMPHMRTARSGHIINVSSVGGLVGQPFNEVYCAAKFAVEGLTESMASYLTPHFNINFTAVEPGGIATEFANTVMTKIGQTGGLLEDEYAPIMEQYLGARSSRVDDGEAASVFQTGEQVAAVIMDVVDAENPPIRIRTSQWAEQLCDLKTQADPDGKKLQAKVMHDILGI